MSVNTIVDIPLDAILLLDQKTAREAYSHPKHPVKAIEDPSQAGPKGAEEAEDERIPVKDGRDDLDRRDRR
jgi:hypothetical protein